MIELSRHIENLMLKHDCVIVPGLGGFVTHYVPARHIAEEHLFLPPCRSVGFNPQLVLNDGLLVQSYMQVYHTGYAETLRLVDEAVEQLKGEIRKNGFYELSGIGKLKMGLDGAYDFDPCEAGVVSPELYGLDALTVSDVREASQTQETSASDPRRRPVRLWRTDRDYTLSISRELVNYAAAAVVALLFYFVWATPVGESVDSNRQAAAVIYDQLFAHVSTGKEKPASAPSAVQPVPARASSHPAEPATTSPAASGSSAAAEPHHDSSPMRSENYTLVLASSITRQSAEVYSRTLREGGYAEARPYRRGRMVRVVYGSYPSREEACKALNRLREQKPFADAWVLRAD